MRGAHRTPRQEEPRRADLPHRPALRGPDPRVALRENADLGDDELAQIAQRLDRLDRARDEPWTRAMLTLIEQQPETKAAELAEQQGRELHAFKRDVRKLEELGLTESMERGYRLSPRGQTLLRSALRSRSVQPVDRPMGISTHAAALSKIGNYTPSRG